jgi:UDP-glucose 4-epimerase
MKVLITGGAGFVGSTLADRLIARGDHVHVIDNFATGRRDNLQRHPGLSLTEGSIADCVLVNRVFDQFQPEVVVHAAASYKDPENWEEDARTNVTGTAIITQATRRVGARRLIYFQTALCYGLRPLQQPITLSHPILSDGSSYAISKTAGEQYIRLSGIDYISFRLANAYGPRNLSGPLPTFFHRLTTNKPCFVMKTRRDFIFINDLVQVVLLAIDGQGRRGEYHVSSGTDYSIKELFDTTVAALGIRLSQPVEERDRTADDVYTILIDPTETNRDFGWRTSTPLEVGVRAAVEWYKTHGVTQTFTHLKLKDAA